MPKSITADKSLGITIRDGVHLDIGFTPLEAQVIDTPQIQRLRNIKQLGFTYLVYPSANHTRFEHSLGVCHLSGYLMDRIEMNRKVPFSKEERAIARAFAIVHDASHLPFGHTLEDEHNIFSRHDKGTRLLNIIDEPELRTAFGDFYEPVRAIVDYLSHVRRLHNKDIHPLVKPYLVDIVAGTIGADLLDYLRRDNLFTGLRRDYDPRVFDYFTIINDELVVDLTKHEVTRIDAISDIMDLLRLRYTLTEKVYYHHTKLAFGAVLAKAVRLAQEVGMIDEKMLTSMGDWDLLYYLSINSNLPKDVQILAKRITPRDLYRRAYVLPRSDFGARQEEYDEFVTKYRKNEILTELENRIADAAEIPHENVVAYCPSKQMQLKESNVRVYEKREIKALVDIIDNKEEAELYNKKYQQLWTFYVFSYGDYETSKRVGKETAEIMDRPNYYDVARA